MGRHRVAALRGRRPQECRRQASAAGVQRVQRGAVHDIERRIHVHRTEQLDQQQRQHREVHRERRQQSRGGHDPAADARVDDPVRLVKVFGLLCLLVLANQPDNATAHMRAAAQATRDHRFIDAVGELSAAVEIGPTLASAWYALGQAYTEVSNEAANTFRDGAEDASWRRLLTADSLLANGRMVDAFALYREALDRLPSMVSIHDSVARIYERSGHADWADRERAAAAIVSVDCAARRALCDFRAGRTRATLDATRDRSDAESRYWRARPAGELARTAFPRLDDLPDSVERRSARAARARAEERPLDAIAELDAALALAPGHPALTYELAAACYAARNYERALATVAPIVRAPSHDARALM